MDIHSVCDDVKCVIEFLGLCDFGYHNTYDMLCKTYNIYKYGEFEDTPANFIRLSDMDISCIISMGSNSNTKCKALSNVKFIDVVKYVNRLIDKTDIESIAVGKSIHHEPFFVYSI